MARGWMKASRKRGIFKRKAGGSRSAIHLRGKIKYATGGMAAHAEAMVAMAALMPSMLGIRAILPGGQRFKGDKKGER